MFKLDEPLKICLLALASRHPNSLVEINTDLLNRSDLWEGLRTVEQVLEHLQVHAPQLLQAPARVLIDEGQAISAIYLLDRSQEVPALYLYSGRSDERPYRHGLHEPVITLEGGDTDLVPSPRRQQWSQEAAQERNSMTSLAFSFPLRAGKTEEWRAWKSRDPGTTPQRVRGIQPEAGSGDAARVPATQAARGSSDHIPGRA